jgi:hypothetical protein
MPPFSHLRSDYPPDLTLFERPYACALKLSYRAGLPSARAITVLLIGSNCWCPSRLLVDRVFDAQHYSGTNGLNIDEKLAHLVESWCASLRGNDGPYSYALTLSLFSPNSALYAVAAVHLLSTSGGHLPITTVLSGFSNAGLDARSALRVCHFLACLFVDSRASQINLGGAHDVSKQRSSKF